MASPSPRAASRKRPRLDEGGGSRPQCAAGEEGGALVDAGQPGGDGSHFRGSRRGGHEGECGTSSGAEAKRRSSCVRDGGVFLRMLESQDEPSQRADHQRQQPAPAGFSFRPHQSERSSNDAESPKVLCPPSLSKLRFGSAIAPEGGPPPSRPRGGGIVLGNPSPDKGEDDGEGGFRIHCSQNYERNACEGSATPDSAPSQAKPSSPEVLMASQPSRPSSADCMKTPQAYSIFRSPSEKKTLSIVRHGESVYNALERYSRSFADPFVFDAPLTDFGVQQALALKDKLGDIPADSLWVASPLTRCIQTMMVAYGQYLKHNEECSQSAPKLAICSSMAEHLCTTGDIGRPKSVLVKQFPKLAKEMDSLAEIWWWSPDDRPNCSLRKTFNCREPAKAFAERVGSFQQWVARQPERHIVAFGHSTFWKEFQGEGTRLRNCEVATLLI